MPDTSALDAALAAQREEWGTYVALVPIDLNGVRAFNPGHPVPVSHVSSGLVDSSFVQKVEHNAVPQAVASAAVSSVAYYPVAPTS